MQESLVSVSFRVPRSTVDLLEHVTAEAAPRHPEDRVSRQWVARRALRRGLKAWEAELRAVAPRGGAPPSDAP